MTLNDGRALVVAFLIEPDAAHGRFKYQTSIYLASLDRPPIKGEHHTYDDVVISTERPDVRIGESWLRGNLDTYGLVVDPGSHGGLGLDATIERVVPSRVSPASTDIVVGGERGLGWVNPIPSGTLAGRHNASVPLRHRMTTAGHTRSAACDGTGREQSVKMPP